MFVMLAVVILPHYRFREGLQECEKMQNFLQQNPKGDQITILPEPKHGIFALLPVAEHTLSQQFTAGCLLPMPVSCVLDSDVITVTDTVSQGDGAADVSGELDFETLLSSAPGSAAAEVVVSDNVVGIEEWLKALRAKAAHFEFQIRKYG